MKLQQAAFALFLGLLGCKTTESSSVAAVEPSTAGTGPSVVDATGEFETTWDYLADKYDANGDGLVQPEEFGRSGEVFDGHDRNGDGVISFADYDPEARKALQEAQRRASYAHAMVALYLQDDEDPERLDEGELQVALAAYVGAGDDRLVAAAFAAAAEERKAYGLKPGSNMARRLEDEDPFETLSAAIDTDSDGALSKGELTVFFERHAEDGVWLLGSEPQRAGRSRPPAPEVGEVAPDFTLRELNGHGLVTLSSFVDDQPVALVFGSYT